MQSPAASLSFILHNSSALFPPTSYLARCDLRARRNIAKLLRQSCSRAYRHRNRAFIRSDGNHSRTHIFSDRVDFAGGFSSLNSQQIGQTGSRTQQEAWKMCSARNRNDEKRSEQIVRRILPSNASWAKCERKLSDISIRRSARDETSQLTFV